MSRAYDSDFVVSTELRPLRVSDVPSIFEIEKSVYSEPWSFDLLRESLISPMAYSLGLFQRDLIGYSIYQVIFSEAHLLNLAIDGNQRGRGHGAHLLSETLTDAFRRGAERIFLEVRPSNEAALSLYRRFGFQNLNIRENYYADGEAAIVMVTEKAASLSHS